MRLLDSVRGAQATLIVPTTPFVSVRVSVCGSVKDLRLVTDLSVTCKTSTSETEMLATSALVKAVIPQALRISYNVTVAFRAMV